MATRPKRSVKKINYAAVAGKGNRISKKNQEKEKLIISLNAEDSDEFEEELDYEDLPQPSSEEEGLAEASGEDIEEGEITDCSSSEEEGLSMEKIKKIEKLAAQKEKEVKQLEKTMKEEGELRKRYELAMQKLNKYEKVERALKNKSKESTPQNSPKKKEKSAKKSGCSRTSRTPRIKSVITRSCSSPRTKSEYDSVLSQLTDLKKGNADKFSELINKAFETESNLQILTDHDKRPCKSKKRESLPLSELKDNEMQLLANECENAFQKMHNKKSQSVQDLCNQPSSETLGDTIAAFLKGLQGLKLDKTIPTDNLIVNNDGATSTERSLDNSNPTPKSDTDNEHNSNDSSKSTKKKELTSGKIAKPDNTDIKKPVKYAHERLDPRHVTDRTFEKLSFMQLIAGELELIVSSDLPLEERTTRAKLLKTLCYHQPYLDDKELKDAYDVSLKNIEKGNNKWGEDNLDRDLHQLLEFRANVKYREKLNSSENKTAKSSHTSTEATQKDEKTPRDKPVFCMEYNRGTCKLSDHHEGKFAGKSVFKMHICRTCLRFNEVKSHPETDPGCPRKQT